MTRGAMMLLMLFGGSVVEEEPTPVVALYEYCVRRRERISLELVRLKMSMLGMMRIPPKLNALSTRKSATKRFGRRTSPSGNRNVLSSARALPRLVIAICCGNGYPCVTLALPAMPISQSGVVYWPLDLNSHSALL